MYGMKDDKGYVWNERGRIIQVYKYDERKDSKHEHGKKGTKG